MIILIVWIMDHSSVDHSSVDYIIVDHGSLSIYLAVCLER